MPNWLKALKVKEISLVDRGANQGAVAVLMKRASEVQKDLVEKVKQFCTTLGVKFEDVQKISEGGEAMPTLEQLEKMLKEQGEEITKIKGAALLSKSIGDISIALSKAKKKKEVEEQDGEVEKLDKSDPRVAVLKEMVKDRLAKAAHHDAYSENLSGDEKTKFESMPMKEKDAYMAKNPVSGGEEGEEGAEGAEEGKGNEEMEKRLRAEINKNTDLRTRVEKMETLSAIEKIRTEEMKDVTGITKEDAEAIHKGRISNKEATDVLVAKIKALSAQVKKNEVMLKELGLATNGPAPGGAQEQLTTQAVAKAKAEGITKEKAMSIILGTPEGKELYKRAEAEKAPPVAD